MSEFDITRPDAATAPAATEQTNVTMRRAWIAAGMRLGAHIDACPACSARWATAECVEADELRERVDDAWDRYMEALGCD
jgi:hypothetical protein